MVKAERVHNWAWDRRQVEKGTEELKFSFRIIRMVETGRVTSQSRYPDLKEESRPFKEPTSFVQIFHREKKDSPF